MRKSLFAVLAVLPFCASAFGAVQVSVIDNGGFSSVPSFLEEGDGVTAKLGAISLDAPQTFNLPGGDVLKLTSFSWDPDPVLTIAFTFTDNGAPSNTGIAIENLLLDPVLDDWIQIDASASLSVTDGGDGNVIVDTSNPNPFGNSNAFQFSANGTSVDLGVSLMPTPSANLVAGASQSGVYGPFNASNMLDSTAAGSGPWTDASIRIAFRGSGGGDIYTANGSLVLTPKGHAEIPEPASAICWSLLAGIGLVAVRRRRS